MIELLTGHGNQCTFIKINIMSFDLQVWGDFFKDFHYMFTIHVGKTNVTQVKGQS
jgi:hypothetical protein